MFAKVSRTDIDKNFLVYEHNKFVLYGEEFIPVWYKGDYDDLKFTHNSRFGDWSRRLFCIRSSEYAATELDVLCLNVYDVGSLVYWDIRSYSDTIYSRSSDEYRRSTRYSIYRNNNLFMDNIYSYDQAKINIRRLEEHPLDFGPDNYKYNIEGKKVWFEHQPAIITGYIDKQQCVVLKPDGDDNFYIMGDQVIEEANGKFKSKSQWTGLKTGANFYPDGDVKVSIFSHSINWFRE